MSRNVSLWMPAVYVYVACCRLPVYYFYMSLIYGACLVNVHFGNIPHSFIPYTLPFIPQKKIRIQFSANYPLTTFRNPHSAKYPFASWGSWELGDWQCFCVQQKMHTCILILQQHFQRLITYRFDFSQTSSWLKHHHSYFRRRVAGI